MIYYDYNGVRIRNLKPYDIPILTKEEQLQGYHVTSVKYEMRLQDQSQGIP